MTARVLNTRTTPSRTRLGSSIGLLDFLRRAIAVRRQRIALSRLEPHILRDIGLSAKDAEREAKRPTWDVPEFWRM